MIKSNELRLGNLVEYDGRIFKIESLTKSYPFLNTPEFGHGVVEYTILQPIPITEEWLIRLGFEKDANSTIQITYLKLISRNRFIYVLDAGTYNEIVFLIEISKEQSNKITDAIVVHNIDYDGKMHIHQLQNLYFALTGEELIINGLDSLKKTDN